MRNSELTILLLAVLQTGARGQESDSPTPDPYSPEVQGPSDEGQTAISGFTLPDGFQAQLYAAEPLLANPVAFAVDARMRFYVAETFRLHAGVTDMREHMGWLADELACRTVEDRVRMMRRHEGDAFEGKYAQEHERVRLLQDTDGDGRADRATVFADGFKEPASGIAAGLLPVGDSVYYACIPDMWLLRDSDGDGVAEERVSQHSGWGVHIALLGHDMHGIVRGPDGRLYWSIGDRGFHVEHEGQVLAHHHAGAVLRSELDGSRLEIFATGLRNPQELAFDDHGNLFTGDNNSDGGDRARWVYLVLGGEAGWRHAYQYITRPNLRGPWNAEKIWHPPHEGQPAFCVPPVANFASGPSGLTYYPGTGWGPGWSGRFFLCDFRGSAGSSGVHSFRVKEKGAGFELVDAERFLWNSLVTDVDFAADGHMYVSDWVHGWGMTGKGRIYRIAPLTDEHAGEREQLRELMASGMASRDSEQLGALLHHGHRGVRMEAQWELASRAIDSSRPDGPEAQRVLWRSANATASGTRARLHALWGVGEIMRRSPQAREDLWGRVAGLHRDAQSEVRAQLLKIMGDCGWQQAGVLALRALDDPEPRVRFFAAQCLGELGLVQAAPALLSLAAEEQDRDPWLRHAVVRALARTAAEGLLEDCAGDPRPAVRRAALLALRTRSSPAVARYFGDPDPGLVAEAVRAAYDVPIEGALEELAALLPEVDGSDHYLGRRVLAAARRVHSPEQLRAIGTLALDVQRADLAAEALRTLNEWNEPSSIDPITGEWRPLGDTGAPHDLAPVTDRLGSQGLLTEHWGEPQWLAWVELARGHGQLQDELLWSLAHSGGPGGSEVRRAALQLALDRGHGRLAELLEAGARAQEGRVRSVALRGIGRGDPERALGLLSALARSSDAGAAQDAVRAMQDLGGSAAQASLVELLDELTAGGGVGAIALELEQAALALGAPALDQALDRLRTERLARSPELEPWMSALAGGSIQRGQKVFREKAESACLRCHAVGAEASAEAGPDLSDVGLRLEAGQILRSIVEPGAEIAEGFENWLFALDDGTALVGRILEETADGLTIESPKKEVYDLLHTEIEARKRDQSSMPADIATHLAPAELRDLVAYLQALGG